MIVDSETHPHHPLMIRSDEFSFDGRVHGFPTQRKICRVHGNEKPGRKASPGAEPSLLSAIHAVVKEDGSETENRCAKLLQIAAEL